MPTVALRRLVNQSSSLFRAAPGELRELAVEVMAAAAHPALDKALDSALNAVPPVPCLPLLLGLGVDQRMSSSKSFTSVL